MGLAAEAVSCWLVLRIPVPRVYGCFAPRDGPCGRPGVGGHSTHVVRQRVETLRGNIRYAACHTSYLVLVKRHPMRGYILAKPSLYTSPFVSLHPLEEHLYTTLSFFFFEQD